MGRKEISLEASGMWVVGRDGRIVRLGDGGRLPYDSWPMKISPAEAA